MRAVTEMMDSRRRCVEMSETESLLFRPGQEELVRYYGVWKEMVKAERKGYKLHGWKAVMHRMIWLESKPRLNEHKPLNTCMQGTRH